MSDDIVLLDNVVWYDGDTYNLPKPPHFFVSICSYTLCVTAQWVETTDRRRRLVDGVYIDRVHVHLGFGDPHADVRWCKIDGVGPCRNEPVFETPDYWMTTLLESPSPLDGLVSAGVVRAVDVPVIADACVSVLRRSFVRLNELRKKTEKE